MFERKMFICLLNTFLTSWIITCACSQNVCSKNEVPWKKGIEDCLNIGQPMPFDGLTGLNIENINLRPDVTVWTSDYIYTRQNHSEGCSCSFRYVSNETFYKTSEELFSYCDDYKYFLCRNTTNNAIDVLNNTWYYMYESRCGSFPVNNQVESVLKPGYYWKSNTTECGLDRFSTIFTGNDMQREAILCGAYSKDAGRHFRRCDTSHRLVCVKYSQSLISFLFDDSCLLAKTTETTKLSRTETLVSSSYQPQWTKPSHDITASIFETAANRPTAEIVTLAGYTKKLSEISTKRIQNTSETQVNNNITLRHARGLAQEHGDPDTGTDTGIIAGIVVGVCLALVAVVVLLIFIHKRCLYQSRSPDNVNGEVSRNAHGTENASFDTIAESINIGVGISRGEHDSNSAERSENIYNKVEKRILNAQEHYYSTLVLEKFAK